MIFMKIIGVNHSPGSNVQKVLQYLLRSGLTVGDVVALENPPYFGEEKLKKSGIDVVDLYFGSLARRLEKLGVKFVFVDYGDFPIPNDVKERLKYFDGIRKEHLIVYFRTLRMMLNANNEGAKFLVTGAVHAQHVKTLLGKRADVIFLCDDIGDKRKKFKERKDCVVEDRTRKEILNIVVSALKKPKMPKLK